MKTEGFWTHLPIMNNGRWYPTCTTLDTGEILITAGRYATENGAQHNRLALLWNPKTWESATGELRSLCAEKQLPTYPFMFQAPNGKAFFGGPGPANRETDYLSTVSPVAWQPTNPNTSSHLKHDHGDCPAVMFEPGKVLVMGGRWSSQTATAVVELIDLTEETPGDPFATMDEVHDEVLRRSFAAVDRLTSIPSATGQLLG